MAKVRVNLRFAPELWSGIQAAVKGGRARDNTDALEQAAAAWLGVDRSGAKPEAVKPVNGKRARQEARPKHAAARSGARAAKAGVRPIPKGGAKGKRS